MNIREKLLKEGILYFTAEDIFRLRQENIKLNSKVFQRLVGLIFLTIIYVILIVTLTLNALSPKIGPTGAISPAGEVVSLTPTLNQKVSAKEAYRFATEKMQIIRTFFFKTYWDDLVSQEKFFTKEAFSAYLTLLNESGMLYSVRDDHINMTATLSPKQLIAVHKVYEDESAFWYVRVLLLLRKEQQSGEDEFLKEDFLVKMIEVKRNESKFGLKIASVEPY